MLEHATLTQFGNAYPAEADFDKHFVRVLPVGRWRAAGMAWRARELRRHANASIVVALDLHSSVLGGKGVGELAIVGVAPAIANAVFHATGKRVRDLPITLEKLI